MNDTADPHDVLGVPRGAGEAEVHAAYRAAVRRTHPDAGGSAAAFEAVQRAYEQLRNPAGGRARGAAAPRARPAPAAAQTDARDARMEDLLAESHRLEDEMRRLEDEMRRLAGLAPKHRSPADPDEPADSLGAIVRDAVGQLRDAADEGAHEIARLLRRDE